MTIRGRCPVCSQINDDEHDRLSRIAAEFTARHPMVVIICGVDCATREHWMAVSLKGLREPAGWFPVGPATLKEDLYARFYELSGIEPQHNEAWDW
jgi:hypothetical protein